MFEICFTLFDEAIMFMLYFSIILTISGKIDENVARGGSVILSSHKKGHLIREGVNFGLWWRHPGTY
jgi:hypothetical protein